MSKHLNVGPTAATASEDTGLLLRMIMETWKLKKRLSQHGMMRYLEALKKKIGEAEHSSILSPPSSPLSHHFHKSLGE